MNLIPALSVSNRLTLGTGFFVAAWALLVIVGWRIGNFSASQLYAGWDPMPYDTALGLFLCGTGLMGAGLGSWRITLGCSALVGLLAVLSVAENLLAVDLRITEFLVPATWQGAELTGRMSLNAAGALFLCGLMLLTIGYGLLQKVEGYTFASMLGLLVALFGLLSMMTFFSTTSVEVNEGRVAIMTPQSAMGFTLLGLAAAVYRWPEDAEDNIDLRRLQNMVITYVSAGVLVTVVFSAAIGLLPIYELLRTDPMYETVQAEQLTSSLRRQAALTGISALLLAYIGGFGVWRLLRPLTGRILLRAGALEKMVHKATADLESNVKKLERSNRQLDQFARVASHDLQSPLHNIVGFTQLLRDRYGSSLGEGGNEFIGLITASANQMQEQISGLLELSRLGTQAQSRVAVRTREVVSRVLAVLQDDIEATGAKVVYEDLPVVHGDRVQVALLFQNLIGNAIKFRRPGVSPEVAISARRADGFWHFIVKDNGIGIAPAHREAVFEIFRRLHAQADYPGTGIGLALCRDIVERHGGDISVESQAGEGCQFCFTLPALPEEFPASQDAGRDDNDT